MKGHDEINTHIEFINIIKSVYSITISMFDNV